MAVRRRILHIATLLQGGAGRVVVDLAVAQRARGDWPVVAVAAQGDGECVHYPEWLARLERAAIPVLFVTCTFRRSLAHLMGAVTMLQGSVAEAGEAVDVVHAHAAVPALVGQLLLARPPVLATMHGWNARKSPDHAFTDVAIFNRLPYVAVPSQASRGHLLAAGVREERIRIVPYGIAVDDAGREPEDAADRALIARWRREGRTIFVSVGSVGPRKNQRLLIEAFSRLRDRAAACAIVGEGPELDAYRLEVRARGLEDRVAFVGYRPQATRWMRAADAVLFPSTREGLPLALLEACAMGAVVVVSDIPEHTGLVSDGREGIVFRSEDVDDCVGQLERVLALSDARRRELAAAAQRAWRESHSLDRMVAGYDDLYQALLDSNRVVQPHVLSTALTCQS